MKHTERDSITVEKLVFCKKSLKNLIFATDTPNGRRLSFENWLKSVISLKLAYFMKI